jgi:hypothetical protein
MKNYVTLLFTRAYHVHSAQTIIYVEPGHLYTFGVCLVARATSDLLFHLRYLTPARLT